MSLNQFTNLYSIQKTLRFELKPIGKTLEHIQRNGLLEQDNQRADDYKEVKKIIDEYHKHFIEKALNGLKLEGLDDFYLYYKLPKKEEIERKKFDEIQDKLRKQIANAFSKHALYKNLFAKELIKEDLANFVKNESEKSLVNKFKNFTTYFTGFHENRKNMYVAEDKSTSIAFRLINQNLPKFIDNLGIFEKIKNTNVSNFFRKIYTDIEEYLNVSKIDEIFTLEYYSNVLTQKQIDVYNLVIGGKVNDDNTKIKGLNEYINLYNQQQKEKSARLPKLKMLYKQILSDRNAISWLPEEFEFGDDVKVLESIEKCYQDLCEHVFYKQKDGEHNLIELLMSIKDYDLDKIYIKNDTSLTDISQKLFGSWAIIQKAIEAHFEKNNPISKKQSLEKYIEQKEKYFKNPESFSIGFINNCIKEYDFDEQKERVYTKNIADYFTTLGKFGEEENYFSIVNNEYEKIKDLLITPYNGNLSQDKVNIEKIKAFLDSIKKIQWFVKPLLGKGNEAEKDERFYSEFVELWKALDQITLLYNKVRNYATRKPYSDKKIKLNFENSTLLDGWDVNKETDDTSIILKKGQYYYLGIMAKKHNKIFKKDFSNNDTSFYQKMEYKLLPVANKMLPKVFFSKSRIDEFNPSQELIQNYNNETHKKGKNFNIQHCHQLIDFFKDSIKKHEDWKNFDFDFSKTSSYKDLSMFYREVEQQGYKISFRDISEKYINQLVDEGKLYLFQIYNKDFSPYSKGTNNMHTLYWKMLFDRENLKNVVYKLNGQAEVFYRKSSIRNENKVVHNANIPIINKNHLNKKKESVFKYDIIKDKRYTIDKFHFHVPITLNFKAVGIKNINNKTFEFLRNSKDIHIIGIDRGERHLLYLTLIDLDGNIKQQLSLNEIVNRYNEQEFKTDYHTLLEAKGGKRDEARKNWNTIETIKELKEGYLSQVIHILSEMIVKYNAIVVLEDLNSGFKQGRQKVEHSVYQKFEKMLIGKLNYLVDKKKPVAEFGGILKAFQLTNEFKSFKKLGKQSGFLFYVQAWNTSKIDPVTGFVNLFDTHYESGKKAKDFFSKFKSIRLNENENYFEFEIDDYSKFSAKAENTRLNWIICSHGTRLEQYRNNEKNNEWDTKEIDLTLELKNLLQSKNIHLSHNAELKESICSQSDTDKQFYEKLMYLFKLTVQMRNSKTGTAEDWMISPVKDENGNFYDSRTAQNSLPKDADANGAYNIARKGLMLVKRIKGELAKYDINGKADDKNKLVITNKEWLRFAQKLD